MDQHISFQDVAYNLLEKLKANGTFDEFRRFCVSDIDAKSAYQNWKQRIESSALKFLSEYEFTPELNKNILWEKMRKHLLDGRDTQDISDGADRILNQLLGPRTLDAFEPKIQKVVNEYLGNENGTVTTEVNGFNDVATSSKRVLENDLNDSFKPKIDIIPDVNNMENIEEISPEFEPLTSVRDDYNSDGESVSGMSDLLSVGSPVQVVSKETNDTSNSIEFETNKHIFEDTQQTLLDKNGMINHLVKSTNNETNNINFTSNNSDKLKTNDLKAKSKHHSSRSSGHTSNQDKSSTHKSKNRNSNSHCSTNQEKNNKKRNDSSSKDKKNSSRSKQHSSPKDKDKKNKHKKSHHTDRDKTPKRDRKDSRSDKKEKSSSLCKEPKSLNGNRSDDESNAGGSSRHKSSLSKNKSSTSEKSKSSSNSHKTSRKDNSKDVVNKSKDKSSLSSSSHSLSQINNKNKKRRVVEGETNCPNKKIKLNNDQGSSITDDDQNAANILLSMSLTPFDNPGNENKKENVIFVDSQMDLQDDITLNTDVAEHDTTIKECVYHTVSSTINTKKNTKLIADSLELPTPLNSKGNASIINEPKTKQLCNEVSAATNVSLTGKDRQLEKSQNGTTRINPTDNKLIECIVKNKEIKANKAKINSNGKQMSVEHDSNTISALPSPKLLPTQIDTTKKKRSIKAETKTKKSKSLVSTSAIDVPIINNASKSVLLKKNGKPCDAESKVNDSLITPTNTLDQDTGTLNLEISTGGFKGFPSDHRIHCKNRQHLMSLMKKIHETKSLENVIDDGFKGFDANSIVPCKNRNLVYSQFIKEAKEEFCFEGFKKEDVRRCDRYKHLKQQIEALQIKTNQQTTINGENGIQSQTTFNNVMSIMRENKKNHDSTQNDNHSQSDSGTKNDCPVVNNNNHDITPSDHWVVEQEMKYKLLPVKVKLERLMEYRRPNDTKQVSRSSKVSSATQRKKID